MRILTLIGVVALAVTATATAQSPVVGQARAQGVAGERYDGYMGLAAPASAALRSAVGAVNIKRRSLYSDLAAKKGVSPQEVGLTAGCQLLARLTIGEAYLLSDGQWRRRTAGSPVPVPAYCGR
ncbi:MAG: YdbL family protein [Sphingomicrobium sp.]